MAVDNLFSTWDTYYSAFASYIEEGMSDTPTRYEELRETVGDSIDYDIVTNLLASGANPQEGFDGLISTLISCVSTRNAEEYIICEDFPHILSAFMEKEVEFDIKLLLNFYIGNKPSDFEDEVSVGSNKAFLIHALKAFIPDIITQLNRSVNWRSITPRYWEEAPEPHTREEMMSSLWADIKHKYIYAEECFASDE
jgi:hypothetical protein